MKAKLTLEQKKANAFWQKAETSYSQLVCMQTHCPNVDWVITVCFYTALQMMKAHILINTGSETANHDEIADFITKGNASIQDKTVIAAYADLKRMSSLARYKTGHKGEKIVNTPWHEPFARKHLKEIHDHLVSNHTLIFTPFIP